MAYQPKSYKKFVATAATATLVATAVVPAAFADEVKPAAFTDVAKQYEAAVNFVVANNIAKGLSETQFGVSAQIKRGDAAIMIANAAGLNDETAPASGFSDVPTRGVLAINSLKKAGVVNGKTATNFGFNDSITRGEAAIMLANAFDLKGNTADVKFTDVSDRYKAAVAALVANDVTNGISATQFGTSNNIKRGDFARFVYALEDLIVAPTEGIQSVTAVNGTVTATFAVAPETAPTASDFVLTRSINGGAVSTVTPSNFSYNEATKSVTFSVPEVAQTNEAQVVTYSVQHKDETTKSASFTVEAAAIPAVQAVANAADQTVTLVFNRKVDITSAEVEANYSYDADVTSTTNTPVFPTSAVVNTSAVGPYAGNQIVTLTFAAGSIVADDEASLTISNVKAEGGAAIPVTTVEVTPVANLGSTPSIVTELKNGAQTGGTINANAGNQVTLTAAVASGVEVSSVRYRLQKPDNTYTSWTNVPAEDGLFDETAETAVATINTTGFTGGAYKVQAEVVDAAGRVATTSTSTLNIVASDITAPSATVTSNTYSTATGRVTVEGTATDAQSNVTNVQYRVQTYNAATNAFSTSTDWTNATAADGTFNEGSEGFSFSTPQLENSTAYRIQVRSVDSAGNTSTASTIATPAGTTVGGSGAFFTTPANSGDTTAPGVSIATTTVGGTTLASGSSTNARDVRMTGTATDNARVSAVQVSVYRDSNGDGSYDTEVQAYTSAGVTAVDGGFNSTSENYVINANLPTTNGDYRILVRSVDAAGNNSAPSIYDVTLDTVAPTVAVTPNTDTAAANDFIFTYSEEVVDSGAFLAADGTTSRNVFDADNYTVQQNGQVVTTNGVTSITQVAARQFIVTFASAPTTAQTLNVTTVQDDAGNAIAPTSYTVAQ